MPLDEITYPVLYRHSQDLGKLARWNGRGAFIGGGVLAIGAGVGALAAGVSVTQTGVILCLVGGLALWLGGLFIGRANVVSATDLKESFDQFLSPYELHGAIRQMREHYEASKPPRPHGIAARFRAFFNF
jgi:hypothetical protein